MRKGVVLVVVALACLHASAQLLPHIGTPTMIHPNQAPALAQVPGLATNAPSVFGSYPFNGGGYNIPGAFGASGGIGWGLGGAGVAPGYIDATRWGLPADYLLPKKSAYNWEKDAADIQIPLYQGNHVFQNGGFRGLRGRSLARFKAVNPFNNEQAVFLNPLNHPNWFFPSPLDRPTSPNYHPPSLTKA